MPLAAQAPGASTGDTGLPWPSGLVNNLSLTCSQVGLSLRLPLLSMLVVRQTPPLAAPTNSADRGATNDREGEWMSRENASAVTRPVTSAGRRRAPISPAERSRMPVSSFWGAGPSNYHDSRALSSSTSRQGRAWRDAAPGDLWPGAASKTRHHLEKLCHHGRLVFAILHSLSLALLLATAPSLQSRHSSQDAAH